MEPMYRDNLDQGRIFYGKIGMSIEETKNNDSRDSN